MIHQHKNLVRFIALVLLSVCVSCSSLTSYNSQLAPAFVPFAEGDFVEAAEASSDLAEEMSGDNSAGLFFLEEGAMNRAAALATADIQYFERSIEAFHAAEQVFLNGYDLRAKLAPQELAEQMAGFGLSQKAMAYKGQVQDRVLLHGYKMLNFLALGNLDSAAVEARRVVSAQEQVVRYKADEIAAYNAITGESSSAIGFQLNLFDFMAGAKTEDGRSVLQAIPALSYGSQRQNYDNDFVNLLVGLVRRIQAESSEDSELFFSKVADAHPENQAVSAELAAIRAGESPDGWGWVLFEDGRSPRKKEVTLVFPVGYIKEIFSVKPDLGEMLEVYFMALPSLTPGPTATRDGLGFRAGSADFMTEEVADMNGLVLQEFNEEWSLTLAREITATLIKALVNNGVKSEMPGDMEMELPSFLSNLFGSAADKALTQADDRAWCSNASRFSVARFPLDGIEELVFNDGADGEVIVPIPSGSPRIIIQAKMVQPGNLLTHVQSFQ